jgi:hypothetical protein
VRRPPATHPPARPPTLHPAFGSLLQILVLSHLGSADAVARACTACRALHALLTSDAGWGPAPRPLLDSTGACPPLHVPASRPPPPAGGAQFPGITRLRVRRAHGSLADAAAAGWFAARFPGVTYVDASRAPALPEEWLVQLLASFPALTQLRVDALHAWRGRAALPAAAAAAARGPCGGGLRSLRARGTALSLMSNDSSWVATAGVGALTRLDAAGAECGWWRCAGHCRASCRSCKVRARLQEWRKIAARNPNPGSA